MTITIGLVANVYNEVNALPGWLETHLPFFDEVRVLHAGPNGEYSDDGTIELLQKWNVPVVFGSIDDGFGVVRTKALRMSKCDYIMLLDADERFYPIQYVLDCKGENTPHSEKDAILNSYDFRDLKSKVPDWNYIARLGANLRVERFSLHNQGRLLKEILEDDKPDALVTVRRHWHDFTMQRPTQNWNFEPDCQMRTVRNDSSIGFDPGTKMHERLVGATKISRAPTCEFGPFFDHFHFTFKRMEMAQRSHDVAIYDAIHQGKVPPTKNQFEKGVE